MMVISSASASSASFAFTTIKSRKRKLVVSRSLMLTLTSRLSNVSKMVFSRDMLNRVVETHTCWTQAFVLNLSSRKDTVWSHRLIPQDLIDK